MSYLDDIIGGGYLATPKIINAFKKIKREDFVLPEHVLDAKVNAPLPIGEGQTISQPATVAFMLEKLNPKSGEKILDIGSGSGWTTALLSEIVGKNGKVYGIEIIDVLKAFGESNVSKYNFIKSGIATIIHGNGYEGLPEYAPFDKIIVSAAAKKIPDKLLAQLKIGGRMVIPMGEEWETQDLVVVDKISENKFEETRYPGFIFVPLVE